jgi:plastocyanin
MKAIASLATVLLLLAGVGLVACGGDDDDDTAATEATTTEEAAGGGGGAAEVSMTEYAFDPADATVGQGEALGATNDGELTHNYTIKGAAIKGAPETPETQGTTTGDLDPGECGAIGVTVDPGEYDVICTIPGHAEKGMKGTLAVK